MSGAITAGTLATVAGIGAAGSIGGALIGSNAAGNAASTQASAAEKAAQLQYQASQNALDFQKQQWNTEQQNLAPWLQMGGGALGQLGYLMGITPNTSLGYQPAQSFNTQVPAPVGAGGNGGAPPVTGNPIQHPSATAYSAASPFGASGAAAGPGGSIPVSGGPALPNGSVQSGAMPFTGSGVPANSGAVAAPSGSIPASSGAVAGPAGGVPASGSFGSLMQGYGKQFEAPTGLTMENDPGYQARLALGTDAMQRSAAARGGLLTGGTLKDLNQYAQDYASNEYGNVYNRALNTFGTNYNVFSNDQANQFNRLAALSGVGQTAANQLGIAGQNASNNVSSNLLNTAANMGQQYNNAAAANASGIVGSANAWGGALNGIGGNLSQLLLLKQLGMGGGSGGSSVGGLPVGDWSQSF